MWRDPALGFELARPADSGWWGVQLQTVEGPGLPDPHRRAVSLRGMLPRSIPADTDPEAFRLLVERWRTMTIADRVALVDQITADVELLAVAGILAEQPALSEIEVRRELARRRFGARLADEAYQRLLV